MKYLVLACLIFTGCATRIPDQQHMDFALVRAKADADEIDEKAVLIEQSLK